jgi:SAM-dependent methyltransferase
MNLDTIDSECHNDDRENMNLICPKCHANLELSPKGYECIFCKDSWLIQDGVIRTPGFDDNQYWSEIPRRRMQHILQRADTLGPTRALEEWTRSTHNSYLEIYALDNRRGLCFELVSLPHDARILDYGCGYGTLGLSMSGNCETVYLADSTFERIRFAKWRALECNASNVTALAIQDWRMIPIPHGSLDLIIINGVLEWIPTTTDGAAVQTQLDFLRSMRKLLKPGGVLYIGIENRYALKYFAGYPDDHTDLKFTSIMPRRLADIYCRIRNRKPYRTVTWSLSEHKRNLNSAGFPDSEIFCMYPDYRFPKSACRIEDSFALKQFHCRRARTKNYKEILRFSLESSISYLRLWPWLVYSFGIIAHNSMRN